MDNLFVLAGPLTMSTMHNELKVGKKTNLVVLQCAFEVVGNHETNNLLF